jgi:hypothetical protein
MHTRSASQSALQILAALACSLLICAVPLAAQSVGQQTAPPATSPATPASAAPVFHEELIAEIPSGSDFKELVSAENHVAWQEKNGKAWIVRLDGKQQGGSYDEAKFMGFNQDGSHLAFFGKRKDKWLLVLDGQERSPEYHYVTTVAFQPHGTSFAFSSCTEKKTCHLVVDGKDSPAEYQDMSFPRYSSDGKRLAYFGKRDKKWIAVVDGKETGPGLESVEFTGWGFSRPTQRFYAAVLPPHSKWTYIVDDAPGPAFDVVSPIAFSNDDKHYAYSGCNVQGGFKKQKTEGTVVLDGQPGATHEGAGMSGMWTIMATGLSDKIAFGLRDLEADFHGVSNPYFDPAGNLHYAGRRGKGDIAVTDGKNEGPAFDKILSGIVFTDDSKHSAYIAQTGKDFVEVRDNQPSKTFPVDARIGAVDWIEITRDGSHLAFQMIRGGLKYKGNNTPFVVSGEFANLRGQDLSTPWLQARRTVVMDDQPGKEYDAAVITLIAFSPDHRHSCYAVISANGRHVLVVVDGTESKSYDTVNNLRMAPDGAAATFLARDSSRLLRVTAVLQ